MTEHQHDVVIAPAWEFCRDPECRQVWDDEWPGVVFMPVEEHQKELALYDR